MAFSILSRLREYVGDRRRAPRRRSRFLASVPAEVALLDGGAEPARRTPAVAGVTRDLSASGLTLVVKSVRVGGKYLTENDCHLGVRLELPAGEVCLLTRVVRFEQPSAAGEGYLLGVRILGARGGADRAVYYEFLKGLEPAERRAAERGRAPAESSGLGAEWPAGAEIVGELRAAFESFSGKHLPGRRT